MRVCFISHSASCYGAEIALLELLQGLSKRNVECLVIVPEKGPLTIELDRLNLEWRVVPFPLWVSDSKKTRRRISRTIKGLIMAIRIAWIITYRRCDLVYTNTICTGVGALAACLARKRHIWHLHESIRRSVGLQFDIGTRFGMSLVERLSTFIIVVSQSLQDDYSLYIERNKIKVIQQSVTISREAAIIDRHETLHSLDVSSRKFQCVMVGSVHPLKRQDEAIRALSILVSSGFNVELVIVGDGHKPFQLALAQQVKDYHLVERVRFAGYAKNPTQFVWLADVVLMCSQWEAFGRVTIEAMRIGKPVIGASNSGGTSELIKDGVTGLLYESGNYEDLAKKITCLYEDSRLKSRLGANAQIWAQGLYSQETYSRNIHNLLSKALVMKRTSL